MLALMPDQPTRPPMNSELESILLDEAITPLALLPLTEDEQVRTYSPHHMMVVGCGSVRDVKILVWGHAYVYIVLDRVMVF